MKKLTALFTIVAMLVCMFTFAPTANAYQLPNGQGERVTGSDYLSNSNRQVRIDFELTCHNGWLDGTFGSDYVSASMSSTVAISCDASINVYATYIENGSYTTEGDSKSASTLGTTMSLTVSPFTDLLAYGDADFSVDHVTYGSASGSLSASCPTALK